MPIDRAMLARLLQQQQPPGNMSPEQMSGGIPQNLMGAPGAPPANPGLQGIPPELMGPMDPLVQKQIDFLRKSGQLR